MLIFLEKNVDMKKKCVSKQARFTVVVSSVY